MGAVRAHCAIDALVWALRGTPLVTVATAAREVGRSPERTNDAVTRPMARGALTQGPVGTRTRVVEVADLLDATTELEDLRDAPDVDSDPSSAGAAGTGTTPSYLRSCTTRGAAEDVADVAS